MGVDFFGTLLWPLRWVAEAVLVFWHGLFSTLGLDADSGLTWLLALTGLLVVLRLLVLPLTLASARSAKKLAQLAPKVKELRVNRNLAASADFEALTQETTALYKEAGVNPLGAILPVIIQVPVFFALYFVLRNAADNGAGVGLLSPELTGSFRNATVFGAPLHFGFFGHDSASLLVGLAVVALTVVLQFASQYIAYRASTTPQQRTGAGGIARKVPLVVFPAIFLLTSLAIQLALALYLLVSSVWTLIQQVLVTRMLNSDSSSQPSRNS